jgi:hypothetical protein
LESPHLDLQRTYDRIDTNTKTKIRPLSLFKKKKSVLVRAGESKDQKLLPPDPLFETLRANAGAIFERIAVAQARARWCFSL